MKTRTFLTAMVLLLAVALVLPQGAWAKAVGRLTQVEGRVDLLKGGKLPAVPVKEGDEVEKGDVLRTKSLSRAQITFVDNSTVTVSPQSRIAIDEYMYDATKGKRNALLQVFYGAVLTAVTKIYQTEQPDFKVKTNTAIMGIRGTQVGIRLAVNSSQFLNFQGITRVSSNYPEVRGHVDLQAMEATEVKRGLPPTLPYEITPQDQKLFMKQLTADIQTSKIGNPNIAPPPGGDRSGPGELPANGTQSLPNLIIYPTLVSTTQAIQTYSFTQNFGINYTKTSTAPYTVANYVSGSTVTGTRTGVYPGNFTTSFDMLAAATSGQFTSYSTGVFQSLQNTGTVTGTPGGTLTGTMNVSATVVGSQVISNFSLSGPVTIQPNGNLSFTPSGTFNVTGAAGTIDPTKSTWSQMPTQGASAATAVVAASTLAKK